MPDARRGGDGCQGGGGFVVGLFIGRWVVRCGAPTARSGVVIRAGLSDLSRGSLFFPPTGARMLAYQEEHAVRCGGHEIQGCYAECEVWAFTAAGRLVVGDVR